VALEVARAASDVEIVSVDSMQVYRGMDVGTDKPTWPVRDEVPHHLLDLADPSEEFTVTRFQATFREAVAGIEDRGNRALLVGGTGLYLRAAVEDLEIPGRYPDIAAELASERDTEALHARLRNVDPLAASRMEPTNRRRVLRALEVTVGSGRPFSSFGPGLDSHPPSPFRLIGLWLPRDTVAQRIAQRYERQVAAGFVDEVRDLAAHPEGLSKTARQALGYRELLAHVGGELSLSDALALAVRRTRRFARRQRAWFRRDPRIRWLAAGGENLVIAQAVLRDWRT